MGKLKEGVLKARENHIIPPSFKESPSVGKIAKSAMAIFKVERFIEEKSKEKKRPKMKKLKEN